MAKYQLSTYTNPAVPGAVGIKITWIGPGAAPVGMKVKITNSDTSGKDWYGAWVLSTPAPPTPLPPPGGTWQGWASMNPGIVVQSSAEVGINLANGPAYMFPTYGQPATGEQQATNYFYSVETISADKATSVASGQSGADVTNMVITVLGGGGDPE